MEGTVETTVNGDKTTKSKRNLSIKKHLDPNLGVLISGDDLYIQGKHFYMSCNVEVAGVGNKQKQGWESK